MTPKEYLSQAFHLDQRINSKLDMLAALKEMATKTTSIMQDDVVSHTRNVHSMEDAIAKIVDMQTEINADIDRLVDKKQETMHTIYAVENPEYQTLLELRYISSAAGRRLQTRCTAPSVTCSRFIPKPFAV